MIVGTPQTLTVLTQIPLDATVAITSLALMFSALIFALIWGPRRLFGKLKGEPGIGVRPT